MGKPPGSSKSFNPLQPPGLEGISPGGKNDPLFGPKGDSGSSPAATVATVAAPAAVAPATPASAEVLQAQRDVRRQALKKKGYAKTIFAGDTAGWNPSNTGPTQMTGGGYPGNSTLGGA